MLKKILFIVCLSAGIIAQATGYKVKVTNLDPLNRVAKIHVYYGDKTQLFCKDDDKTLQAGQTLEWTVGGCITTTINGSVTGSRFEMPTQKEMTTTKASVQAAIDKLNFFIKLDEDKLAARGGSDPLLAKRLQKEKDDLAQIEGSLGSWKQFTIPLKKYSGPAPDQSSNQFFIYCIGAGFDNCGVSRDVRSY
jgi:hypothetical protein